MVLGRVLLGGVMHAERRQLRGDDIDRVNLVEDPQCLHAELDGDEEVENDPCARHQREGTVIPGCIPQKLSVQPGGDVRHVRSQ